jgi:hypothetical protein
MNRVGRLPAVASSRERMLRRLPPQPVAVAAQNATPVFESMLQFGNWVPVNVIDQPKLLDGDVRKSCTSLVTEKSMSVIVGFTVAGGMTGEKTVEPARLERVLAAPLATPPQVSSPPASVQEVPIRRTQYWKLPGRRQAAPVTASPSMMVQFTCLIRRTALSMVAQAGSVDRTEVSNRTL